MVPDASGGAAVGDDVRGYSVAAECRVSDGVHP
jgi:hypothetical protein